MRGVKGHSTLSLQPRSPYLVLSEKTSSTELTTGGLCHFGGPTIGRSHGPAAKLGSQARLSSPSIALLGLAWTSCIGHY